MASRSNRLKRIEPKTTGRVVVGGDLDAEINHYAPMFDFHTEPPNLDEAQHLAWLGEMFALHDRGCPDPRCPRPWKEKE